MSKKTKKQKIEPRKGFVYFLKGFTAPKVFMGDRFECILTTHKLSSSTKIIIETCIHVKDWSNEVYLPERFNDIKK